MVDWRLGGRAEKVDLPLVVINVGLLHLRRIVHSTTVRRSLGCADNHPMHRVMICSSQAHTHTRTHAHTAYHDLVIWHSVTPKLSRSAATILLLGVQLVRRARHGDE